MCRLPQRVLCVVRKRYSTRCLPLWERGGIHAYVCECYNWQTVWKCFFLSTFCRMEPGDIRLSETYVVLLAGCFHFSDRLTYW